MGKPYSIYEAKARFSELLRQVKRGAEVTVTERGEPIAKVIPFPSEENLENRLQQLIRSGQILARLKKAFHASEKHIVGGLKRFLKERE